VIVEVGTWQYREKEGSARKSSKMRQNGDENREARENWTWEFRKR
jgi:hypothetical protein